MSLFSSRRLAGVNGSVISVLVVCAAWLGCSSPENNPGARPDGADGGADTRVTETGTPDSRPEVSDGGVSDGGVSDGGVSDGETGEPPPPGRLEAPETVHFGLVREGEMQERRVRFENVGGRPVTVAELFLDDGKTGLQLGSFEFAESGLEEPDRTIPPGGVWEVPVKFTARSLVTIRGFLQASEPAAEPLDPLAKVDLVANANIPCLKVEPADEIAFDAVERGGSASVTLAVQNCSPGKSTAFSIRIEGDAPFSIDGDRTLEQRSLAAGETASLDVVLNGDRPGTFTGRIVVETDDPRRPRRTVELIGSVVDGCPRPVIAVRAEDGSRRFATPEKRISVRPTVRLRLDASFSAPGSAGGSIQSYSWSVASRPANSSGSLESAGGPAVRAFRPNRAGEYVVELGLRDDLGRSACSPGRLTLDVRPKAEIFATLDWKTPGDPDPADKVGADLNLHLLHPKGSWNRAPWDAYFANPDPHWQMPGGPAEAPELLRDSVDGRLPERIELVGPEDNRSYALGVHYFSARGFGPSRATVRIWKDGRRVFVRRGVELEPGEFWYVADLPWPGDSVDVRDEITQRFPQ